MEADLKQSQSKEAIDLAKSEQKQESKLNNSAQKSLQELDKILGDFGKQINLASNVKDYQGICNACNEPIVGKQDALKAQEGNYHKECFQCPSCKVKIEPGVSYYLHQTEKKPYHQECFEEKFLEVCLGCQKRINQGKVLKVSGSDGNKRSFHTDCFKCGITLEPSVNPETTTPNGCGAQLKLMQDTTEKYFIKNGTAYCQLCHDNLFLPRCNGCNDFIRQSGDGDGKIHFYRHENESFCAKCYEEKFVPLCSRCNTRFKRMESGEMDKFVVVGGPEGNGGVRLHRSCFNCEKCHRQFDQQVKAYLWKQTNLVCREHYEELSSSNE